jgi:hypothetical protein
MGFYMGEGSRKRGLIIGLALFGLVAAMLLWLVFGQRGSVPAATHSGVAPARLETD